MPRDGSGIMSWPPNTTAIPNTTIESGKYNAFLADLLADLNNPRPLTAGGTGSNTVIGAADNLHTAGANIASAATTDLSAATGMSVTITGAAAITSFGVETSGVLRFLTFAGAATLTHNAASLILPGAANIVTAAGDTAIAQSLGGGNWRVLAYQRASGQPIATTLSDAILPARLGRVAQTITDWNNATANGWYMGSNVANAPDTSWWIGEVLAHIENLWVTQTIIGFDRDGSSNTFVYRRDRNNGTWGSWYKLQISQAEQDARYLQTANANFKTAYESAQQTITAGGSLTLAHGLGVKPKLIMVVLQNTTAEGGFSVGDELLLGPALDPGSGRGVDVVPDATNLFVRFGSSPGAIGALRKDTGAGFNITTTSWRLVLRAWV